MEIWEKFEKVSGNEEMRENSWENGKKFQGKIQWNWGVIPVKFG